MGVRQNLNVNQQIAFTVGAPPGERLMLQVAKSLLLTLLFSAWRSPWFSIHAHFALLPHCHDNTLSPTLSSIPSWRSISFVYSP